MKLLNNLEKKFGKFAIRNLMMHIIILTMAVFLFSKLMPQYNIESKLTLIPYFVLSGEIWRLITYIFIPQTTSIFWIIFILYFYYMIGANLEHEWGSFKFNVYYLIGMLGTTLSAFITGAPATAFYLNMSLFLAFAYIFPNFQILLFFFFPVKIKYLAWLDAFLLVFWFLTGSINTKLSIIAAIANFLLFFGKDILYYLKHRRKSYYHKKNFSSKIPIKSFYHKCTVCGITEKDNTEMEFRYCSKCNGDHEFCMDHLNNHAHIVKEER